MKTSYSMLAIARDCRLRFLWTSQGPPEAVDPTPRRKNMFIGHVLQRAVERFYKEQWWKSSATLHDTFRDAMTQAGDEFTLSEGIAWDGEGEKAGWIAIAHEAIAPIISVIRAERLLAPGVLSEYDISVKFGSHTVYGRVDFILPLKEGLLVLDGKGGKTFGKYTDKNQLLFYGLGVQQDPKIARFPDRFGFWWFRHTKIQWRKFPLEARDEFLDTSGSTLDLLEKKDYTPTPGQYCRICDFFSQCDAGRKFINSKATQITDLDIPDNCGAVALD